MKVILLLRKYNFDDKEIIKIVKELGILAYEINLSEADKVLAFLKENDILRRTSMIKKNRQSACRLLISKYC